MAKRVFLHIGTMKSATSFIQDLCNLNSKALADAGVLWSGADHFAGFHDLLQTEEGRWAQGRWQHLERRIRRHSGDALVSNELLAGLKPPLIEQVVQALAPAEVHIIVTARDLARVIPSQWQTTTRNRGTFMWADYLKILQSRPLLRNKRPHDTFWRRQDVADIVARWSTAVPVERITVVTVPPAGSPPDTIGKRFGSVAGINVAEFKQPPRANPSLGAHSAELMRRLNVKTRDFDLHRHQVAFKKTLARGLSERAGQEPKLGLSEDQVRWATRRAEKIVEALEASSVSVVGDLADLIPSPDLAQSDPFDPGRSTPAELLAVARDAITCLSDVLGSLGREYDGIVRGLRSAGKTEVLAGVAPRAISPGDRHVEATGSAEQQLLASEDLIVALAGELAQLKIDYDLLVGAVMADEPVDTHGEQWQAYLATGPTSNRGVSRGTRRGRFVRWRLEQRDHLT